MHCKLKSNFSGLCFPKRLCVVAGETLCLRLSISVCNALAFIIYCLSVDMNKMQATRVGVPVHWLA
jgi:hypothetical protein